MFSRVRGKKLNKILFEFSFTDLFLTKINYTQKIQIKKVRITVPESFLMFLMWVETKSKICVVLVYPL